MVFNSLAFLVFLPVVLILYSLLPPRLRWIMLLGASLLFYGWWKAEYLVLLGISIFIGYSTALGIDAARTQNLKKGMLTVSFAANLGILFFYKYFGFFASTVGWSVPAILLPVGISFYTFQILSYTVDVYRGSVQVERNIARFALYASFFPQLVAGPIERTGNLLPQLRILDNITYENLRFGMQKICIGLVKKVVLADRLALLVNTVYSEPTNYTGPQLVLATIFFGIQIYGDFSGYSDIAIGCARIFGINLMENFRRPYLSRSISEFWSRWHISLSTWFRDYVYIPLGGNRRSPPRVVFNIFTTFLLSGLWHGANWTFIVWGAWHGVLNLLDRLVDPVLAKLPAFTRKLLDVPRWFLTISAVMIGWVFFRAKTLSDAVYILRNIFSGYSNFNPVRLFSNLGLDKFFFLWSLFMIASLFVLQFLERKKDLIVWLSDHPALRWFFFIGLIVIFLIMGVSGSESTFIYFQF